ncbi:TPA: toprim domain-containing protein [Streptococcus suis]|nr:toprim domain-containing protein [Streptococcus suis]HEM3627329.1 toprim domain-containing protein [Streptococcus suis]HEM3653453.1 toprim domain-containing protein [Streptococcus suis]HEM3657487.1 toprim domain-containing protein [Streptococcus suis]HEM3700979.1 toprim domain-containing protein [Streptococcus suis]
MAITKAQAKALSILEVARSLGMEMERSSHKEYYWKEHDSFKINTVKNTWNWYSRTGKYGDTINLVQEIKGVSYKEAMAFLETGNFPEATIVEEERKPFRYTLAPYEKPFRRARSYLKQTRGLSDETIDFFLEKGILAEASYRDRDGYVEDVLVFKFLDRNHHIVGASLQGLSPFPDRHEGKGYLKKIMYQSEGIAGLNVTIGSPKRLIVAEAPIDLMSYYELHKYELEDVCLVAMDGLKEGTLSRYAMEVLQERGDAKEVTLDYTQSKDLIRASNFLSETARLTNVFHDNNHQDFLTLAVDNDKAGQDFIDQLQEKKIPVVDGRPPKATTEEKMDWNAYLQLKKKGQLMEHQNKRLTQNKEVEPHRKETKSKKTKTAEEHYFDWIERMAATVQEQLQLPSPPKLASELEAVVGPFITTDLDRLFARRLSLALDTYRVESSQILSVHQAIDQLDKQISERMQEQTAISYQKENALEQAQGHEKSAEGTIGDLPAKQEAAPLPEANESQPLNDLSPSQTQPQPLLHFTTKDDGKSIEKRYYHPANQKDIAKLNRYAPTIQQTARWYLDTIADSHVIYLYKDGESISSLAVQFGRDKFMHLTGIFPYREHQTATQTLEDFANGKGDFDSILIANKGAAFDKIKVLPELEAIIQSDSFYFGDLSEVPKLKQLDMDKAIRSGDEDVVLAMRTVDGTTFPASLLKLRQTLALQLEDSMEERTILGVYRYRDSQLDQLSINQEYIKDGGEVFKPILAQVVENLVQSISSEPNMEEDMVYHNQPSFEGQMSEKTKPESVDQSSYAQPSSQNKLNELLASKDRAGLAQHLKEGIHQYLDSTQYKEFLKTMSRFPHYSYRNVMLLKAQKPDVQAVTSFKSWKEDFGRSVKKGEKSLRIFAPMVVKAKDPETGEVLKDDKGQDITRTIFKLVPVFDISQTEGKELPQPIYQLEGTHENYAKLYRSAKEYAQSKGLRFEFDANLGEANGYYSRKDQKIVIKSGMSEQQTLKTIYHELAHADLHSSKTTDKELKYSHAELQAESVAYIVSNHYGLDTGSYTFGYLASWTEDKTALTDLEAQLEIVQKEAQQLIYSLDRELEKQLEQTKEVVKPVEKLSFEERLARAEKQSHALVEQQRKEEEQSKKQEGKLPNQER